MLTVHHLNQSRSHRVLWALEELGLTYEIVRYQRENHARTRRAQKCIRWENPRYWKITDWFWLNQARFWNIFRKRTIRRHDSNR